MAEKYIDIVKALHAGDISKAKKLQYQANEIISELCKYEVIPAEKAALDIMGIPMGKCLKPFGEVGEEARNNLRIVLSRNGCLL